MAPNRTSSRLSTKATSAASKPAKKNKAFGENFPLGKLVVDRLTRSKRKAETSPCKDIPSKRTALGELTNNVGISKVPVNKKTTLKKPAVVQSKSKSRIPSAKTIQKHKTDENLGPPPAPVLPRMVTRGYLRLSNTTATTNQTVAKPVTKKQSTTTTTIANGVTKKRLSNVFEKNEESLYSTAIEDINETTYYSTRTTRSSSRLIANSSEKKKNHFVCDSAKARKEEKKIDLYKVPEGVWDYDKENWDDIYQVSHYVMDIFNYYKEKETQFPVSDYMIKQVFLTPWMRSLLVDWMVEIQESFELNHETLYLGVKLVDLYLDRVLVHKENLQLVGAVAMFLASKFDERIPPKIEDFIYICDEAYERSEMIEWECRLLKVVDFNLGIPLSYRFLRRYARAGRISMPVLTLARYILEYSLMFYETISIRDSMLASASLYIAIKMKYVGPWTPTLQFYTGYKVSEFKDVAILLNKIIHEVPNPQIMTIRNKYSHKLFFEVAKTPLLNTEDLF